MPLPSYLRVFADTTASEHGRLALEYVKALCRIAPVRVVSVGPWGQLMGPWDAYGELTLTPMHGPYVNVVCAPPDAWIRTMQIPMAGQMWDGMGEDPPDPPPKEVETAEGITELYTVGVRNILIATRLPSDATQLGAARRYEAIIHRTVHEGYWSEHCTAKRWVFNTPITDHAGFRAAILGAS